MPAMLSEQPVDTQGPKMETSLLTDEQAPKTLGNEKEVHGQPNISEGDEIGANAHPHTSEIKGSHRSSNLSRISHSVKDQGHKVVSVTRHITAKVGGAAKVTINKTKQVIHQTEDVVEHSKWCFCARWILHLPHTWPRTMAFFFGVCVPIWVLILVSMGFGSLLADYENEGEIIGNDQILAARESLRLIDEQLPFGQAEQIGSLIRTCASEVSSLCDPEVSGVLATAALEACALTNLPESADIQELSGNSTLAFESLSFTWNRCWNPPIDTPSVVFHPTKEMILAVRPDAQEEYYTSVWKADQMELYAQYRPENATVEEDTEAMLRSFNEASGRSACTVNTAATAWFFFTIMTTVGYGNQAPVTSEGRLLVVVAGAFSLVLFAAALGMAGFFLLAIFDDCVARVPFGKILTYPGVGVLFWGAIWLLYATAIATDVEIWWNERLPEFGADIEREDTLWFAFISTSTIGLGDYFLQPEVIFASDTLKYSVLFMIGFVFLSTLLGKVAESLAWMLPRNQDSFHARLKATRVLGCWERGFMPWEPKESPVSSPETSGNDVSSEEEKEEEITVTVSAPEDLALVERIEHLNSFLVDPPVQVDGNEPTPLVSASQSSNRDLLRIEQDVLQKLLQEVELKMDANEQQTEDEEVDPLPAVPEDERITINV